MSNVFYSKDLKGSRIFSHHDRHALPNFDRDYVVLGKVNTRDGGLVITPVEGKKPRYVTDYSKLSDVAKRQLVSLLYNDNGSRNDKTTAYLCKKRKVVKVEHVEVNFNKSKGRADRKRGDR